MGIARQQPFDRVPDLSRPGFVAGWLNKGVIPLGAARDIGSDAYNMTRVGKPVEERVGMTFDGVANALQVDSDLGITAYPFTLVAWVKTTTVNGSILQFVNRGLPNNYFELIVIGSLINLFSITAAGTVTIAGPNIADDAWHRVVAVFASDTDKRLYLNGTLAGSDTTSHAFAACNRCSIARRGDSSPSLYYAGSVKDARVYNFAWTLDDAVGDYAEAVPDDDLRLSVDGRGVDLTRYGLAFTKQADVIVGHEQSYDGTGDYLDATAADWRAADEVGSLIAWIRPADIAKGMAIFASSDEGTDDYLFEWALTAAGVQFIYALENTVVVGSATGTAAMLQDVWQQLVLTSDGSNYLFYRNGVLDALAGGGTDSGAWLADVTLRDNVTVGGLEYNSGLVLPWEGQISYVKYLSRILSADEVAEIYVREEVAY